RRAGGHARHAPEAGVDVLHQRGRHRLALEALLHEMDPPARRVHLLAPQRVRRAGGQAEPAVHAVVDQPARGRVVLVERAQQVRLSLGHQIPPTNRPGARFRPGSSCRLIARMRSRPPTGPHTSSVALTSYDARSTVTLLSRGEGAAARSRPTADAVASGVPVTAAYSTPAAVPRSATPTPCGCSASRAAASSPATPVRVAVA